MRIQGLHHVAIAAADIETYERTVAFYQDVIGLPLVRTFSNPPRRITMLDMGGTVLEIVSGVGVDACGPVFHLAFQVESPEEVDGMVARCVEAGCTLHAAPSQMARQDESKAEGVMYGFRNGFVIGPAGERLEFFCEL